ncbi:hypothetical protein DUNSADRAFT_5064 [Dunaliella salina]|uniref:Encoded protein n=1 Tax=Dunaliella salina TaxID=3046 RepID=A0ABQ7HAE6_DUNSA|nr:hypothetical protein DUNSADRAFT_5064 [Dunaliella salina]|eukprot:KAF5843827.1 hypothetical protein DUNSADRAFT_5064 [Dunaliella salina]
MANTCFFREVHPPTGVTAAVSGFFTHTASAQDPTPNLIIARATVVDVFEVRSGSPGAPPLSGSQAAWSAAPMSTARDGKLELVGHFPLCGVVESMVMLKSRSPGIQRDALMLAFRDAKLCVLEWDTSRHGLRTTSMHYFEGDPALRDGRKVFADPPRLLGDLQGRFAAMILYNHYLAILPAIEADQFELLASLPSTVTDPTDVLHEITAQRSAGMPLGSAAALGNGYLLNLAKLGGGSGASHQGGARVLGSGGGPGGRALVGPTGIKEVRDCVLLNGYTEPVLLVLHQPDPTWPGRYKDQAAPVHNT